MAATGLTGQWITQVTGSGADYTVSVVTGAGQGTLGLNLVDDDSITDSLGDPLGGTGPGNGDFTGEGTVDLDDFVLLKQNFGQ